MIIMRKNNRIPLSPCLRRFRFYFDLLGKTAKDYLFFTDLQENLVMVSPNLVNDFDLPGEIMHDLDSTGYRWYTLRNEESTSPPSARFWPRKCPVSTVWSIGLRIAKVNIFGFVVVAG